jgi:hypothetical protein
MDLAPQLIFSLVSVVCSFISFQKGKTGFGLIGLVGIIPPLAPVVVWFPLAGALRYAKPESSWARYRYEPHQVYAARQRFPGTQSPIDGHEPEVTADTQDPGYSTPSHDDQDPDRRSVIVEFLFDAWAKGIISEETHQRLRDLLDVKPIPEPQPLQVPPPSRPPAPAPETEPVSPTYPQPTPIVPIVRPSPPAPVEPTPPPPAPPPAPPPPPPPPPPSPPPPPRPSPVATMLSQLWDAVVSDIALHGFAYLGVLLTFVGVLGFLLFAFADIPDAAQPFIELFIALVFFGWAWVLRRQDAEHVADGMELIGGMVLPLILFAGLVDGAPFPPDFRSGGLIVALTITTALLALVYVWFTARQTDSTLRYLVSPLLWLGALTAGFVFKTDEVLASVAITRLVPPQPALAAAAIALALAACLRRPRHRLSLPSIRASLVGLPVAYLLTISLSVGEGWARTWPIILLGVSTFVSAEILMAWYQMRSWATLVRPFLLAGALVPLTPALGMGWSGLMVAVSYVVLFERTRRDSPRSLPALLLPAAGVLAGAGMALAEAWPALVTFSILSVWAHLRRTDSWWAEGVRRSFHIAAAMLPVGIGYALVQILEPGTAWSAMASILAVVTAVVRWRRDEDAFWPYWLTAAAVAVAVGSMAVWIEGDQSNGFAAAAVLITALTVGLAPRWPIPRLWAAGGLLSVGLAMVFETVALPFDRRVILWAVLGLGAVIVAAVLRRPSMSHLAAIGHIIGTITLLALPEEGAGAIVLSSWSLGWVASSVAQELGGDSFTELLVRASASVNRRVSEVQVARWVAPVLMVASLTPAAIDTANLSPTFAANRSWTGVLIATMSLAYALAARLNIARKPLAPILSLAAVASSMIGVAVAAPDPWPTIYASAAVIGVSILLTGTLRRPWFVWFAWLMSVVMILLLAERAGVPSASLHLVSLIWGGIMMLGGLIVDGALGGRRTPGEGLRIPWIRHPVLLGALVAPVSLGPVFLDPSEVYGWWALGAAAAYFGVAYLIRAGAVTGPAFGLLALGLTAVSPRSLVDEPWLFIFIAAPMAGVSWIVERLQSEEAASEAWLRWDLPPLLVAHLVSAFALIAAIDTDSLFSSALAFGLLSLAVGLWRRHRAWIDAGNLLLLISMYQAGRGWLALVLLATAFRGAIGAWRSEGLSRASHHAIGVVSAGLAWVVFIDWLGLSAVDAVNYSALVFGGFGLAVSILLRFIGIRLDTVTAWGGLAVAGLIVTGSMAVAPGGPGIVGPSLAIGIFLMSAALEIARKVIAPSFLSVVGAGLAWLALAGGLNWNQADTVTYSALVFGFVALATAAATRLWDLDRDDVLRWGGLGMVGVLLAALFSVSELGVTIVGPWIALGLLLLAISFELAWPKVDPALRYLAAATAGLAWLAVAGGLNWSRAFAVGATAVVFSALMVAVVEPMRFWHIQRDDQSEPTMSVINVARAWAALGAIGLVVSSLWAEGTDGFAGADLWVSAELALLAIGAARGARPLEVGWLREGSAVAALLSLNRFAGAAGWPDELFAPGVAVLAALATFGALALWRRRPGSSWVRPLAVLAVISNLEALFLVNIAWPQRALLVAVLLSIGVQVLAVGAARNSPGILALGPPLVGLSFILAIAESASGTAQWYTVPIALVLLAEVEILRKMRRDGGREMDAADALALEWAGLGLLATPSLVEMFTTGLGFGLLALGIAAAVFLWAIVTRVRRRAIGSASLAVIAAVMLLVAAAAGAAPASAFFWIVAAGIGFAVMLVAALVEAYRSRKGRTMARLNQLMEGWE